MRWPARTIWDIRIQTTCGIVSARSETGIEVFLSATFAQVSLEPPLIAINPNRLHPIEPAIRLSGRFAINVMPHDAADMMIRLHNIRRREPRKAEVLGLRIREDHGIPYVEGAARTIFCELQQSVDAGDHPLFIASVLESRILSDAPPLLYRRIGGGQARFRALAEIARTALVTTGALDRLKKIWYRRRPPAAANIAQMTYEFGGETEDEIARHVHYGLVDRGRKLEPPPAPAIIRNRIGVCVVGSGWGAFHCDLIRRANPRARLFVAGRNAEKTSRLARAVGADACFSGFEAAAADDRVQALTLALPHDLHRQAAETAAEHGKHALVEKPIATNLEDADAMIDAAKRAGTILMVAEDMHFRPAIAEAVMRIRRGDLGEPLYLLGHAGGVRRPNGWAADQQRMGGGVLMDIGVHYVRGLRLLMGEPHNVLASRAMQINTRISGEDSVQLLFSSHAGWEAHMLLTWATNHGILPDFVIAGEKGTLHLWPAADYLDYYPVAAVPLTRWISYVRPYWLQNKLMRPGLQRLRTVLKGREKNGYLDEMREFLSAVAEGRRPVTAPEDGRRDLEIVLRAYESLGSADWIGCGEVVSKPAAAQANSVVKG